MGLHMAELGFFVFIGGALLAGLAGPRRLGELPELIGGAGLALLYGGAIVYGFGF